MQTQQVGPANHPPVISTGPSPIQADSPSGRSPRESSSITVVYSTEGPLGLEFENMNFPYKVEGVRTNGVSAEKGIRKGDSLLSVNGKSTQGMTWEQIRLELSARPATAVFQRDAASVSNQPSMWSIGAGLIGGVSSPESEKVRLERDELKEMVASLGVGDFSRLGQIGEDLERSRGQLRELQVRVESLQVEKEQVVFLLEEERSRCGKLVEVMDEMEKSQSVVVDRFESEIQDRERQIAELKEKISQSPRIPSPSPAEAEGMRELLEKSEAKLDLIEKDNSRLRKENSELGIMVQKCLEKIQRDLSDKPHWVDRRIVTRAVSSLLAELDGLDESNSNAIDVHLRARQKLGDILGLTDEERSNMRLLSFPSRLGVPTMMMPTDEHQHSISQDFLAFLEQETTTNA